MKIAVSIGDLNGIGLECFAKALYKLDIPNINPSFILFGPHRLIINYLDELDINFEEIEKGIRKCLNETDKIVLNQQVLQNILIKCS